MYKSTPVHSNNKQGGICNYLTLVYSSLLYCLSAIHTHLQITWFWHPGSSSIYSCAPAQHSVTLRSYSTCRKSTATVSWGGKVSWTEKLRYHFLTSLNRKLKIKKTRNQKALWKIDISCYTIGKLINKMWNNQIINGYCRCGLKNRDIA